MHVRHAAPELLATTSHPAWDRFSADLTGTESVLLVASPAGVGREWFAQSWSGDRDARIIHVRDGADAAHTSDTSTAGSLAEAFRMHAAEVPAGSGDQTRLALILDSPTVDWAVLADHHWCMARPTDLLLTVDEIMTHTARSTSAHLAPEHVGEQRRAAEELHRLTGGWLDPTLLLLRDPSALTRAHESMLPLLSHWIVRQHDGWEMAKSAFLDPITTETLFAFFREVHGQPPCLDDLAAAGFLVPDEDGVPFMPDLIRRGLKTLIRQNDRALADDLIAVAIDAVAESSDLVDAVQQAAAHRHWQALGSVLIERGMELFTSDARVIRRVLDLMPAAFVDQWLGDFSGAAVRLLKGAGKDGMSFVLPDGSLEYARDGLASRLHAGTTRLYRDPGSQALAFGLIEVGYLRIAGHDVQAAAAARRLLTALHTAESQRRLRPALASVVSLHAGVALEIGGDPVRAYSSYRAAYYSIEGSDHHFLLADTTSKLALHTALGGNTHEAREWIAKHDRWIGRVGWGGQTVGRNAQLARALVALTDIDLDALDAALTDLPTAPDHNETWQIHTYLLAMRGILAGQPNTSLSLIRTMRHQRPHPSRSPLAQHSFAIAGLAAAMATSAGADELQTGPEATSTPEMTALGAYRAFVSDDVERAVRLLSRVRTDGLGARWLSLVAQLHVLVGRHDSRTLTDDLIDTVVSGQGALMDLVLLQRHGVLTESDLQRLSDDEAARLATISPVVAQDRPRPALTPREREVLDGLREGLTRKQIAERQFRSENTVRSQVRSLYQKLGAGTLDEALEAARRWGL